MNGGYIMVDCTGLDLTLGSTEQTISGLYAKSKAALATNKPIYANNTVWGEGNPMSPIQVFGWQATESLIIFTSSTLQIWVTSADKVTIGNMGQ